MYTIWQRARLALSAFWQTFTDPETQIRDMGTDGRAIEYAQAWAYYGGKMFSRRDGVDWTYYLSVRQLYKHTRLIYNPVPQVVDFYVDNLWQPAHDEEFESLVTPVADQTDETLKAAIAQIDQWTVFASEAAKIKRYGVATGNVLIEGIDDLEREKILHKVIWPAYVVDLTLNDTGDVLAYALEYPATDPVNKRPYTYRKEVTRESFKYFRDGAPFTPEGKTAAVEENPYGFCFAVWIKHRDLGADMGQGAFKDWDKVDEANSFGSHLHDNVHKLIESPVVVSTKGEITPIVGASTNSQTGEIIPQDPRLNWVVFKTEEGASVHDLASKLKLAEAHPYLRDLLTSFDDDYPELQAAAIIQKNSQLSGAALERMLTPAQNRLDGVQPNWNQQLIKLRQMQIAVAGMRYSNGDWSRTAQQAVFAPFGLDSYEAGLLDFNLKRSVIVQQTEEEQEELMLKKATRATLLKEKGVVDQQEALSVAGYSDEEAKIIIDRTPEPAPPSVIPIGLPENRQLEAVN